MILPENLLKPGEYATLIYAALDFVKKLLYDPSKRPNLGEKLLLFFEAYCKQHPNTCLRRQNDFSEEDEDGIAHAVCSGDDHECDRIIGSLKAILPPGQLSLLDWWAFTRDPHTIPKLCKEDKEQLTAACQNLSEILKAWGYK